MAAGHCETLGVSSSPQSVGTVEKNRLPDGWSDCIIGHCVLDELETPVSAFSELARAAAPEASIWLSGPATPRPASLKAPRVGGGHTIFWPVDALVANLTQTGFADISVQDVTADLLRSCPMRCCRTGGPARRAG